MSAGRSVNSLSQNWCTPPKYVEAIKEMFDGDIQLDPCSNKSSIVHANVEFILPKDDGLSKEWNYKTIYINPPYGADRNRGTTIKDWLRKCYESNEKYKSEILALVPVATNTTHWKHYVFGKAEAICFLYDTRLKFLVNGSTDNKGAPMSCCIIYWGSDIEKFRKIFMKFGAVVDISDIKNKKIGHYRDFTEPPLFDEEENSPSRVRALRRKMGGVKTNT